jgi:hypothetical protein
MVKPNKNLVIIEKGCMFSIMTAYVFLNYFYLKIIKLIFFKNILNYFNILVLKINNKKHNSNIFLIKKHL